MSWVCHWPDPMEFYKFQMSHPRDYTSKNPLPQAVHRPSFLRITRFSSIQPDTAVSREILKDLKNPFVAVETRCELNSEFSIF